MLFRDHRDYIAHLAIQLATITATDLATKKTNGELPDAGRANEADISEARELLKRAGVRLPGDPQPTWHYAHG